MKKILAMLSISALAVFANPNTENEKGIDSNILTNKTDSSITVDSVKESIVIGYDTSKEYALVAYDKTKDFFANAEKKVVKTSVNTETKTIYLKTEICVIKIINFMSKDNVAMLRTDLDKFHLNSVKEVKNKYKMGGELKLTSETVEETYRCLIKESSYNVIQ